MTRAPAALHKYLSKQLHAEGDATGEDKTELCKILWFKGVKIYLTLHAVSLRKKKKGPKKVSYSFLPKICPF